MANTFTGPTYVKAKPHASAEKQVGDSDPSARTDVINRVEKGIVANLKRVINALFDGITADFTDLTTVTAFGGIIVGKNFGGVNSGLTLSNNAGDPTNDIDIAIGEATSDDAAVNDRVLMSLTAALTKQSDVAWAVGSAAGWLDTGVIGNGTYHVWIIKRPDTGVVDSLLSLSATAPSMPTNYTKKWRKGSIVRTGGAIVGFINVRSRYDLKVPINSVNTLNPGAAAVTATLVNIPALANIEARIGVSIVSDGGAYWLFTALDTTDTAPSIGVTQLLTTSTGRQGAEFLVRTNATPAIRYRTDASGAATQIVITSLGWIDPGGTL